MSASPTSIKRRAFLSGLATVPLIGGGVTLIGQPTAAAVPVTEWLLDRYMAFLSVELRETVIQSRELWFAKVHPDLFAVHGDKHIREDVENTMFALDQPKVKAALYASGRPSARAAVVLAVAGVTVPGGCP